MCTTPSPLACLCFFLLVFGVLKFKNDEIKAHVISTVFVYWDFLLVA